MAEGAYYAGAMIKKRALEALGAFLSYFFILLGAYIIAVNLQVMSHPDPDSTLPFYYYSIQDHSDNSFNHFMIGCAMISAGLTFLWFQRKK